MWDFGSRLHSPVPGPQIGWDGWPLCPIQRSNNVPKHQRDGQVETEVCRFARAFFNLWNKGTGQHRLTKQKQRWCKRVHSSDVFCVKTWSNDATEKKGQGKTGKRRTTLLRMLVSRLGGRLGAVLLANASQKMRWSRKGDQQIITAKTPRSWE